MVAPGPRGGGLVLGRVPGEDTLRDGYCCERYASYLNAFLFNLSLPSCYFTALFTSLLYIVVTLRDVGAYDHYVSGVYYKTSAGLTDVPTDIPAEARQVQLYNNAIGNSCAKIKQYYR